MKWTCGSAAPNSAERQRWGTAPAARTVPRIDWSELLGVSCNRLLDGALEVPDGVWLAQIASLFERCCVVVDIRADG